MPVELGERHAWNPRTWPQRGLMACVRFYRFFLSPWLGSQCRFTPTCSAYALEALARHGAGRGSYLAVHRLCRCRPGCAGGHDPVPLSLEAAGFFKPSPRSVRDVSDIDSNPGSSSS